MSSGRARAATENTDQSSEGGGARAPNGSGRSSSRRCLACAIQKSALRAAFVMWPALALLQAGADEPTLPAKSYLSIALAILTLTFSISYLVSSYVGGADE
jgi:hypothetical protein